MLGGVASQVFVVRVDFTPLRCSTILPLNTRWLTRLALHDALRDARATALPAFGVRVWGLGFGVGLFRG